MEVTPPQGELVNFKQLHNFMKTKKPITPQPVDLPRLVRHWLQMGYGRICHAVWLRLPVAIAMQSRLGSHLLAWAGYWANLPWSAPNDQAHLPAPAETAERKKDNL